MEEVKKTGSSGEFRDLRLAGPLKLLAVGSPPQSADMMLLIHYLRLNELSIRLDPVAP